MGDSLQDNKNEEKKGGLPEGEEPNQGRRTPSPYDLKSNDNLGNLIKLRGENYKEWACAMRSSLRVGKKWGFVEATIAKLKNDGPSSLCWCRGC